MLILGDSDCVLDSIFALNAARESLLLLETLSMLASLLVLDKVLELDLRLPSQFSLDTDTDLCLCFFDIGGLGGRGVLMEAGVDCPSVVRAATSITEDTPRLEVLDDVSTYITAPIC